MNVQTDRQTDEIHQHHIYVGLAPIIKYTIHLVSRCNDTALCTLTANCILFAYLPTNLRTARLANATDFLTTDIQYP